MQFQLPHWPDRNPMAGIVLIGAIVWTIIEAVGSTASAT